MPKKQKQPKHLSSNDPVIFFIQATIVVVVLLMVSFVVYLTIFGQNNSKLARQGIDATATDGQNTQSMDIEEVIENGVDETIFFEGDIEQVEDEKFENLFPELK